jgi:hypothetical protein
MRHVLGLSGRVGSPNQPTPPNPTQRANPTHPPNQPANGRPHPEPSLRNGVSGGGSPPTWLQRRSSTRRLRTRTSAGWLVGLVVGWDELGWLVDWVGLGWVGWLGEPTRPLKPKTFLRVRPWRSRSSRRRPPHAANTRRRGRVSACAKTAGHALVAAVRLLALAALARRRGLRRQGPAPPAPLDPLSQNGYGGRLG